VYLSRFYQTDDRQKPIPISSKLFFDAVFSDSYVAVTSPQGSEYVMLASLVCWFSYHCTTSMIRCHYVSEVRVRPASDDSPVVEEVSDAVTAEDQVVSTVTDEGQGVQTAEKIEEQLDLGTETAVYCSEEKIDMAEVITSPIVEVAEDVNSSVVEESELSLEIISVDESQVGVVELERTEQSVVEVAEDVNSSVVEESELSLEIMSVDESQVGVVEPERTEQSAAAPPVELGESVVELETIRQTSTLVEHAEMASSSDDVFSESFVDKQCAELSLDAAATQAHREHKTSSILSTDEYESSMALSCCQSEVSLSSGSSKPCFIRKLPSRVEITEGQSFSLHCRTAGAGCKPWFVKKLPTRIDVERGKRVDLECIVGNWSDDFLEFGASSSVRSLERKKKTSARGEFLVNLFQTLVVLCFRPTACNMVCVVCCTLVTRFQFA